MLNAIARLLGCLPSETLDLEERTQERAIPRDLFVRSVSERRDWDHTDSSPLLGAIPLGSPLGGARRHLDAPMQIGSVMIDDVPHTIHAKIQKPLMAYNPRDLSRLSAEDMLPSIFVSLHPDDGEDAYIPMGLVIRFDRDTGLIQARVDAEHPQAKEILYSIALEFANFPRVERVEFLESSPDTMLYGGERRAPKRQIDEGPLSFRDLSYGLTVPQSRLKDVSGYFGSTESLQKKALFTTYVLKKLLEKENLSEEDGLAQEIAGFAGMLAHPDSALAREIFLENQRIFAAAPLRSPSRINPRDIENFLRELDLL